MKFTTSKFDFDNCLLTYTRYYRPNRPWLWNVCKIERKVIDNKENINVKI